MEISDSMLFERCILIKWRTASSRGVMLVKGSLYEKRMRKFKGAFKNCDIYYLEEFTLTPERLEEIENEIEGLS